MSEGVGSRQAPSARPGGAQALRARCENAVDASLVLVLDAPPLLGVGGHLCEECGDPGARAENERMCKPCHRRYLVDWYRRHPCSVAWRLWELDRKIKHTRVVHVELGHVKHRGGYRRVKRSGGAGYTRRRR